MPSHIALLFENRYTSAITALTASSEASALPVEASANPDRSYIWRSLSQNGVQTIDIDLGSVLPVTAVAVANVRLVGTGVLELYQRGDAASPGGATIVTTLPTQDRDTRAASIFFASQSHRHWQLKWTNPTSATDYAELGFAFLGVELEPDRNIRVPADLARADPSITSQSSDGQKSFARRTKYFTGAWEFLDITEADLSDLRELWDEIGVSTPVFMVLDTSLAWTTWYASLVGQMGVNLGMLTGQYTVTFPWEEVR